MSNQWMVSQADFRLLKMQGPERLDFLQRLLTNDMQLQPGRGCGAYFLNVQGRPLVQFGVFETGTATWLVVGESFADRAFTELDNLHFGEKLKIEKVAAIPLLHLNPPAAVCPALENWCCSDSWLRIPNYGDNGYLQLSGGDALSLELYLEQGAVVATPQHLKEMRFRHLSIGLEDVPEKTLFLEIASSADYSETKGCYPGQEVVARTLHRGHINKRLLLLEGRSNVAPLAGAELLAEAGTSVGTVLSSCVTGDGVALLFAIVRRGQWEPGTKLRSGDDIFQVVADKG
jgi:tRNA-modifying protein YgfZ